MDNSTNLNDLFLYSSNILSSNINNFANNISNIYNTKQLKIDGAISNILAEETIYNSVIVTNEFGKMRSSIVTPTELLYVENLPIPQRTKYPREPMTANTKTYTDGSGVTVSVTGSSEFGGIESYYGSFTGTIDDKGWASNTNYNISSGIATIEYVTGYKGEFIMIDLGEQITLNYIKIYPRTDGNGQYRTPKEFKIFASNSSTSYGTGNQNKGWTEIYTGSSSADGSQLTPYSYIIGSITSYRYFMMVVNKNFGGGYSTSNRVQFAELELYGDTLGLITSNIKYLSDYIELSSNLLKTTLTTTSNTINTYLNSIDTSRTAYILNTSNTISGLITNLSSDNIPDGTTKRFIINNSYNSNLTINGRLNVTELAVLGDTFNINTTSYKTSNLNISTLVNTNDVALKITTTNTTENIIQLNGINSGFTILANGNVGIGKTNPGFTFDVIGGINIDSNSIFTINNRQLSYNDLINIPSTFNPLSHPTMHNVASITNFQAELDTKQNDLGLIWSTTKNSINISNKNINLNSGFHFKINNVNFIDIVKEPILENSSWTTTSSNIVNSNVKIHNSLITIPSSSNITPYINNVRVYPPAALATTSSGDNTTSKTLSGQLYGDGVYNISWSSDYGSWRPSHIFDGVNSGAAGGHSDVDKYDTTTGNTTSTAFLVSGYNGEWVRLKLPNAIYLSYVILYQRNNETRTPIDYKIYGTNNNGTNWTEIISTTNAVYTNNIHSSVVVNYTTTAFIEYGIVINKIKQNASYTNWNFDELQFYGNEMKTDSIFVIPSIEDNKGIKLATGNITTYSGDIIAYNGNISTVSGNNIVNNDIYFNNSWRIYANNDALYDLNFENSLDNGATWNLRAKMNGLNNYTNTVYTNFTGIHHCKANTNKLYDDKYIGYIVSTTKKYCGMNSKYSPENLQRNFDKESWDFLPVVQLSSKAYDKSLFGIITKVEGEDPNERYEIAGVISYPIEKKEYDRRLHIAGCGEGGIWVCDYNGVFEAGDFITTSPIPGIGMKQEDELVYNYTVGKITMDCNFNPNILENDEYEYEMKYINESGNIISLEEYNELVSNNIKVYRIAFVGCSYNAS